MQIIKSFLFTFLLGLLLVKQAMATNSSWDLKFVCDCSTCGNPPYSFELKNIDNLASDISSRFWRSTTRIELKHQYQSTTRGRYDGGIFWKSGSFSRVWFKYEIWNNSLRGWGQVEDHRDCTLTGRQKLIKVSNDVIDMANFGRSKLCRLALAPVDNKWDYLTESSREAVFEANKRGLSPSRCASILGRGATLQNAKFSPENAVICKYALTRAGKWDERSSFFSGYVKQAKALGLSQNDCQRLLGERLAASDKPTNKTVSKKTDKQVCDRALSKAGVMWNPSLEVQGSVLEAKKRGISEVDCARIVGRPAKDVAPSYELVKRAQEAMQVVGIYSGKIDGVIGIKTKAALKKWQKTNGMTPLGKITRPVVESLERAASKRLAQIEERRVAEAKRAAESKKIKNPHAVAVIIGNSNYGSRAPSVKFAGNDADAVKEFIIKKLGFRTGNIIDLRDASQAELLTTFGSDKSFKGKLFDYVRPKKSDVVVFYSGHGVPGLRDKRGYLLPVDGEPNRAELSGYPIDLLLKNLAKIPSRTMKVFIDACFSGDSPKGMLIRAASGLTVKILAPKSEKQKMIVITAAEGDQFASWDEDAKLGLFTKHLLEALKGVADKKDFGGNNDGKVTLGEVKYYLDEEMTYQARRRFSRDQRATVSGDPSTILSAY